MYWGYHPAPAPTPPPPPGIGFRARDRCICGCHGFAHLAADDQLPVIDPCSSCKSCGYYEART